MADEEDESRPKELLLQRHKKEAKELQGITSRSYYNLMNGQNYTSFIE